ncbi:MAG: hypothetical protein ABWJ63_04525, partial [Thermus sp.]|uniref:hypothetical protein n=1 Tax=Thermus sp. TaxID=275 RepID=UPI00351B080B
MPGAGGPVHPGVGVGWKGALGVLPQVTKRPLFLWPVKEVCTEYPKRGIRVRRKAFIGFASGV